MTSENYFTTYCIYTGFNVSYDKYTTSSGSKLSHGCNKDEWWQISNIKNIFFSIKKQKYPIVLSYNHTREELLHRDRINSIINRSLFLVGWTLSTPGCCGSHSRAPWWRSSRRSGWEKKDRTTSYIHNKSSAVIVTNKSCERNIHPCLPRAQTLRCWHSPWWQQPPRQPDQSGRASLRTARSAYHDSSGRRHREREDDGRMNE